MTTPTTHPATGAEAPPFCTVLLGLLRALARGRAPLVLEGRSLHGLGQERLYVGPDPVHIPGQMLKKLLDAPWEWRTRPGTSWPDGRPADLTAPAVLWRPATQFNAGTEWRHEVDASAQAQIREALAGFPLPAAYVVAAGPEVWACWPLAEPMPVDASPALALALLEALTRRLGGDLHAAQDLRVTLPLAGIVRNWNSGPAPVEILAGAPGATYTAEQLHRAIKEG
jgi:hypothetical protein